MFCEKCGAKIEDESAAFCEQCGTPLDPPAKWVKVPRTSGQNKKLGLIIGGSIAAVGLVGALAVGIVFSMTNQTENVNPVANSDVQGNTAQQQSGEEAQATEQTGTTEESDLDKAIAAYKEAFQSDNSIPMYGTEGDCSIYVSGNEKFALAYMNNDNYPELIINGSGGMILSYRDGKVVSCWEGEYYMESHNTPEQSVLCYKEKGDKLLTCYIDEEENIFHEIASIERSEDCDERISVGGPLNSNGDEVKYFIEDKIHTVKPGTSLYEEIKKLYNQNLDSILSEATGQGWNKTYVTATSIDKAKENLKSKMEDNADNYIFPESNTRELTDADVAGLSEEQLALGYNEIFARRGCGFGKEPYLSYFGGKSWYVKIFETDDFNDRVNSILNDVEIYNYKFLKSKM